MMEEPYTHVEVYKKSLFLLLRIAVNLKLI